MTARIRIARTTAELDALFVARHKVFVEEQGNLATWPNQRIADRFDAFPSTANIIALVDERVVGGVRLSRNGDKGSPLDEFFDFSRYLPSKDDSASVSQFCLLPDFRGGSLRLGFSLLYMGAFWAFRRGIRRLAMACGADVARLAQGMGYQQVAPKFPHPQLDTPMVPLLLDLRQIKQPLFRMARRPGLLDLFRSLDWQHHRAGDRIVKAGEPGRAAYFVVAGEVIVRAERSTAGGAVSFELGELGPGEIFGELALFTSRLRTADVVAASDVDLVVLERQAFREALQEKPERLPEILELLAERLAAAKDLLRR